MFDRKKEQPSPRWFMFVVYLLLLALCAAALIGLRNCSSRGVIVSTPRDGASRGDTIDVAMLYAPLNYYMYDDTLGGYSYDLMRLISRKEAQPFNIVPVTSLQEALAGVDDGRYDLVASMPVSASMRSRLAFTDSVFTDRLVVVYRAASPDAELGSPLELAGRKIHLAAGSAAVLRLRNLQAETGDTLYLTEHPDLSGELIALKVANGDFDYGVANEHVAIAMQRKFPELKVMPIGFTQFQSWGVATSDTLLLDRLNGMLRRAASYPETAGLRKRYNL